MAYRYRGIQRVGQTAVNADQFCEHVRNITIDATADVCIMVTVAAVCAIIIVTASSDADTGSEHNFQIGFGFKCIEKSELAVDGV